MYYQQQQFQGLQLQNIPVEITTYVPVIAAAVANEVTDKANSNQNRLIVYNELSQNNWSNPQFIDRRVFYVTYLVLKIPTLMNRIKFL
jgi:hypothetical protein